MIIVRYLMLCAALAAAAAPCGAQQGGSGAGAPQRKILAELFTGTWCPPCVKNTSRVEALLRVFEGRVIPVSIHTRTGRDPMATPEGDKIDTVYGIHDIMYEMYYMYDIYDRSIEEPDPLVQQEAVVEVKVVPVYDPATRTLSATLTATFVAHPDSGDIRFNLYVVEDSVVGSGWEYDQVNGHNEDPGSFYFKKGNPIAGYVHRNVLRAIPSGVAGTGGVIPSRPEIGVTYRQSYTYTIPELHDPSRTSLVGFVSYGPLGDPWMSMWDGYLKVLNTADAPLIGRPSNVPPDVPSVGPASLRLSIAPMPIVSHGMLRLALPERGDVTVELVDLLGRPLRTIARELMEVGEHGIPIDVADLPGGTYTLLVRAGGSVMSRVIVVAR